MTKHLIFDLDGTLIDSAADIHHCLNATLAPLDIPKLSLEETKSLIGNGSKETIRRALELHNITLSPQEKERLYLDFIQKYMEQPVQFSTPYPGVIEGLKHLKSQGFELSLCTNKPYLPATKILEHLKWNILFEQVAGGDSFAVRKPDPLPLHAIMKESSISMNATYMIGDSRADILAGTQANIATIWLDYGYHKGEVDTLSPTYRFSHFSDFVRFIC